MLLKKLYFGMVRTSKKVVLDPFVNKCLSSRSPVVSSSIKSALYLSGSEATSTYAVLSPYLRPFNQRLKDDSLLNNNIQLRGLDVDLPYLRKIWASLNDVQQQKATLETTRKEVAELIKKVKKSKDQAKQQELHAQGKQLKQKLKITTQKLRNLEEEVIPALLNLPNDLHSQTLATDKNIFQIWSKPAFPFKAQSHVTIGKTTNQLEIIDCSPTSYYLKNELAVLELAIGNFFSSFLVSHGYARQSNPDFSKSVVVDGCGFEFSNKDKIFTLEAHESDVDQSCLHLTGGSSLPSFASYFTKQVIEDPSKLPLKQFTVGRNYIPNNDNADTDLFNCSQSTSVDAFIVFENKSGIEDHMIEQVLLALTQSYTQLKIHFRILRYGAEKLGKHESGAIGIEMFSPVREQYYEVGRVSICGTYISERLWCLHNARSQRGTGASFVSMIHVRVCHVAPWLALLMENMQQPDGNYHIPKVLKPFMFNVNYKYT